MITKALIIDEPWLSKILAGDKVWEMRSTKSNFRGPFALIRKGSGKVIGIANLVNVSGPYSNEELAEHFSKHHVGRDLTSQSDYKWRFAWELSGVKTLTEPVAYKHKSGAVTWVSLDDGVTQKINDLLTDADYSDTAIETKKNSNPIMTHVETHVKHDRLRTTKPSATVVSKGTYDSVSIRLNQGNINNNHIYLSSVISFFPDDCIGGANKSSLAPKLLTIDTGIEESVQTDIAGDKKIFRNRSAIRRFIQIKRLKAGDIVRIERTSELNYRLVAECA